MGNNDDWNDDPNEEGLELDSFDSDLGGGPDDESADGFGDDLDDDLDDGLEGDLDGGLDDGLSDDFGDGSKDYLADDLDDDSSSGEEPLDGELGDEIDQDLEAELFGAETGGEGAKKDSTSSGGGAIRELLSSTQGKAVAGASGFVLLLVVFMGYATFSGGGGSAPSSGPQIAQQSDDWGDATESEAVSFDELDMEDSVAEGADSPGSLNIDGPVAQSADSFGSRGVSGALRAINQDREGAEPRQHTQALQEPSLGLGIEANKPGGAAFQAPGGPQAVDVASIKQEIIDAVRAEISQPQASDELVGEALQAINSLREEVASIRASNENRPAQAKADPADAGLRSGRTRLKGFSVVNATGDGSMSVVKTPSERINVYFEGETFSLPGRTVRVSGIEEGGNLVLVEDDLYIDKTRVPRPKAAAPSARASSGQALGANSSGRNSAPVEHAVRYQPSKPPAHSPLAVVSSSGRIVAEAKVAPGWTLNATMRQGFLVKNPRAEFAMVRQGDNLEGLGIVDGLDRDGNLRVGIHKIVPEK